MTRYVALLRGINVGRHARIGMPDLRRLCSDLGHVDVTTYLQSGNLVFTSPDRDAARLAGELEARITEDLGHTVRVLLRTGDQLATVAAGNPFLDRENDPKKLLVAFLEAAPTADRAARLVVPDGETAEFALAGREIHLYYPAGYGRTKLHNNFIEQRLGVAATTRNWKTVTALRDLCES